MYSDIKQASGLLQQQKEGNNRAKILSSFNELKEKGVILNYVIDERKKGRAIVEIKYTIKASPEFIKEQMASNKRATDTKIIAQKSGIQLINKS